MIWVLLVVYQIKHFIADYPLQGPYMLRKFLPTPHWILPLMAHAGVHAAFTALIALAVSPRNVVPLALIDFAAHFMIDRLKASPNLGGRFKTLTKETYSAYAKQKADAQAILATAEPGSNNEEIALDIVSSCDRAFKSNTYFWWALGADQTAHHLTHYMLIYLMLRG